MMGANHDFDQLSQIWKKQEVKTMDIAIEPIKIKAREFERKIKVRNALEWVAVVFLIPWITYRGIVSDIPLLKISAFAMAIGAFFVAVYLFLKGRVGALPDPTVDSQKYIAAYRKQLLEQSRLLKNVPFWYLLPLSIGTFGIVLSCIIEVLGNAIAVAIVCAVGLAIVFFFGFVAFMNLREARKLKEEADDLDP